MVEIIPKPIKKISNWQSIAFYLSLAFLATVVALFFIFNSLGQKAANELQAIEDDIARIGGPGAKALEAEVFATDKKVKDFAILLGMRRNSSNFFQLLEKDTHPQVWFSKLTLEVNEFQAVLLGKAPNFQILGQQLLIFQADSSIENVELSELTISKEGEAEFSFLIHFDPAILQ